MLKVNAPIQLTQIFATGAGAGPVNNVPLTPSSGQPAGQIAYSTGFSTTNMTPIASGGVPPWGADMNGLWKAQTTAQIWAQAGYIYPYSSAFATNGNIGGYPNGALLASATANFTGFWLSTADNNTTNPDSNTSANWVEVRANGGYSTIALSGSNVTLTENQLGPKLIILTGTLTANISLTFPLRSGAGWIIQNATTGSFTVTVAGSTGTGVTVTQGTANGQEVYTDGINYYSVSGASGGPYLPLTGTAVAAAKLATARTIAMTGPVTWSVSFDGSASVTSASTLAAGAVALSNMANLTGNTLLGNPTSSAATPSAITLTNGLIFSSGALGMGAITPTSIATGAGSFNGGIGPITNVAASMAAQGIYVGWNGGYGGFNGETDFYNNLGGGTGGWAWVAVNSAGTTKAVQMSLGQTGALTVTGNVSCNQNYTSFTTNLVLAPMNGTAGGIYLRPQGAGSATANCIVFANGTVSLTAVTCTTINATSSDRRLKKNFKKRDPKNYNGVWFGEWDRIDVDFHGVGPTAQAMQKVGMGHHVHEYDYQLFKKNGDPGHRIKRLNVDYGAAAFEQGLWCGLEIIAMQKCEAKRETQINNLTGLVESQATLIKIMTERLAKLERV